MDCCWKMGGECEGEVVNKLLLGTAKVPICVKHFTMHKQMMAAHSVVDDLEALLSMSPEERADIAEFAGETDDI